MKKIMLSLVIASALIGCKQEPVEVVQSVDWYKENTAERLERLAKCRASPGELADTPNCINAEQATSLADAAKRGGLFEKVEPMPDFKLGR